MPPSPGCRSGAVAPDNDGASQRIFFCHCAYAHVLPQATKDALLAALDQSGAEIEHVPDLCELAARKDPCLSALAQTDAPIVLACHPRAVQNLFAQAGAPLPPKAQILDMRTDSPDRLTAMLPAPSPAEDPPTRTPPASPPAPAWLPWFPVIDHARCTQCMQCLSFCLFDVYSLDEHKRLTVANPANCKTDCPACSRVCPEVAIIFPKYRHGPINGEEIQPEDITREKLKVDISGLLGGDIYSALRARSQRARSRFSKERDEDQALAERRRWLEKLQQDMAIPPDVIASLPSPEQIRAKAQQAATKADAARGGPA